MRENATDLCWVKYLKRVQYQKNTTHHSTIGLTPYEALYNHKPSSGLLDFGIPNEVAHEVAQDLECIINSINETAAQDNDYNPALSTTISPYSNQNLSYPVAIMNLCLVFDHPHLQILHSFPHLGILMIFRNRSLMEPVSLDKSLTKH